MNWKSGDLWTGQSLQKKLSVFVHGDDMAINSTIKKQFNICFECMQVES